MSFTSRLKNAAKNQSAMFDLFEAHTKGNDFAKKEECYKKATAKMQANGITDGDEAVQTMKDAKNLFCAVSGTIFWGTIAVIAS